MRRLLWPGVAAVAMIVVVFSCGTGDPSNPFSPSGSTSSSSSSSGGVADGAVVDGVVADASSPPKRSAFGLDLRPQNPSCVARGAAPTLTATAPVTFQRVFTGLGQPLMMAQLPGDSTHWFVADRSGTLARFETATPANKTVVANLAQLSGWVVGYSGEGGFLGFAPHPRFAQNGRIYVTWNAFDQPEPFFLRSHVGYITSTDGGASFTSYTDVLSFDQMYTVHFGGGIAFGHDGYLYVSFGDGAVDQHGQSTAEYFSKILRIDVDNVPVGQKFGIPTDNPFRLGGGEPATYAFGFRNPFRFSFDRATGDLWVGDVGLGSWEEVDRVERGGNYGWPCREGKHDYYGQNPTFCPNGTLNTLDPVIDHEHVIGVSNGRSITGGVVYRGRAIPSFVGSYVYGDFVTTELFALRSDPTTGVARSTIIPGPDAHWVQFAEDNDGEIYGLDLFTGDVHKMVPSSGALDAGADMSERLSATGCVMATDPKRPAPGVIPYNLNAPFWSDGAEKERFLALPDGKTIAINGDGDFDFPNGSVLIKNFSIAGKRIETRLFMRHEDGAWAGYSYEWLDDQSDAILLPANKRKSVGAAQDWYFPSRAECMRCHTERAGRTLGLELGQLNRDFIYVSTNRISNQLDTLDHIGLFAAPLATAVDGGPRPMLPSPFDVTQPIELRARAYLHANCAGCHRPPGEGRAQIDLRFSTVLKDTATCGLSPLSGDQGIAGAKILTPGSASSSLLSIRPHATNSARMPALASSVVDVAGLDVVDSWIKSLTTCPQ